MKTEDHDSEYTLTYDDSPEAKERIYQIALKWFKKHGAFDGDSIHQCDEPQIEAPYLASSLAEKGFKFKLKEKQP